MRKTFRILVVVVIVAALFATPGLVAARGGNGGGRGGNGSGGNGGDNGGGSHRGGNGGTWFNVYGTVVDTDESAWTIDVMVLSPLSFGGETITVQINVDTRLRDCEYETRIDFEDLALGARVRTKGVVKAGVFTATSVILNPETDPTL